MKFYSKEKILGFQLPHVFKKIGKIILLLGWIYLWAEIFIDLPFAKEVFKAFNLLGLLLFSLSTEKTEDELIRQIRMESYVFAGKIMMILIVLTPVIDGIIGLILHSEFQLKLPDSLIMIVLFLLVQIIHFHTQKAISDEK